MVEDLDQLERNVSASFGYVKKDLMNLNDVVDDLQQKMQHLSMNHAALLQKISEIENELVKVEKEETNLKRKTTNLKKKVSKKKSKKK